jgi:FixJ family two-component response regulator
LRVAAEHHGDIDLLVTDVLMPGIRGPELVEELTIRSPGIRVLYMSGYTDEDISRWGLQPGMAFIHKPFTSEGFSEAVNEVLNTAR